MFLLMVKFVLFSALSINGTEPLPEVTCQVEERSCQQFFRLTGCIGARGEAGRVEACVGTQESSESAGSQGEAEDDR